MVRATNLDDLVGLGSLAPHAAVFLDAAVRAGLSVLVSGATQAGNPASLVMHPLRGSPWVEDCLRSRP